MMNKTVIDQFNTRFHEALSTTLMPNESITDAWFEQAKSALTQATTISLGLSAKQFIELYDGEKSQMTLMGFATLANNLERQSATALDMTMDQYLALIHKTEELAEIWNNENKILHDKITSELAAQALQEKQQNGEQSVGSFGGKIAEA